MPEIIRGTRALTMVALHADRLPQWRESMQKELVPDVEHGLGLTTRDIARSEVLRSVLWQRVRAFMATRDLLVLPTVAVPPFPVEQPYPTQINGTPLEHYFQWFYLTYGITLTGLPAISVPCGFTRRGLPVGLQIVGRRRQEAAVLRAAAAFEAAAAWAGHLPPVVTSLATEPAPRPGATGVGRPAPSPEDLSDLASIRTPRGVTRLKKEAGAQRNLRLDDWSQIRVRLPPVRTSTSVAVYSAVGLVLGFWELEMG